MSYASVCISILVMMPRLKMFKILMNSLYASLLRKRALTFSKNMSSLASAAAARLASASSGVSTGAPFRPRIAPRPRPFFPAAGCVESGKKYVNSSNRSLCDLKSCATSSYTCEIVFKFFLYMFKISKKCLYTRSSFANLDLILFTYEMA